MTNKKESVLENPAKFNFMFGLVTGIAGMSLLLFVGLLLMFWSGNGTFGTKVATNPIPTTTQPTAPTPTEPVAAPPAEVVGDVRPIDETDHAKGPSNAQIQFIEYSDFECPFCSRFQDTIKQVEAEYGDQVQFAFRHFPLSFHLEAQKAGEAAECAADQGKFWEMHNRIFAAQNTADFNVQGWKKIAGEIGLNTSTFNDCLDSGKNASKITDGVTEGSALGISGTPTAFINGQIVRGALPFAQVKAMIDAELAK